MDLLKALLLDAATDLGNPGPDYTFGCGIPDVVKAVKAAKTLMHNLDLRLLGPGGEHA